MANRQARWAVRRGLHGGRVCWWVVAYVDGRIRAAAS